MARVRLAFRSTIDDPNRFKSSSDVGAYLGLTPRRYQSGELDRTGRISKRGDRLELPVRSSERPAQRGKAMVRLESLRCAAGQTRRHHEGQTAVARKLAVVLHRICVDGTEFQWGREKA